MQKEYLPSFNDQWKLWRNTENPKETFVELNLSFTRPLSYEEKNQIVLYVFIGMEKYNILTKYGVYSIDFTTSDFIQLTYKVIDVDRERALLQLLVDCRKQFPIKSPTSLFMAGHNSG